MKHKVFSPLGHSLPYRDQKPGYMLCFLDSVHCNSLYSQVRISRKGTLHKHGFLSLQEITIYSLHVYGVHRRFFFLVCLTGLTLWPHPAISTAVTVPVVRCTCVAPTVVWTAFVTVRPVHTAPFTTCITVQNRKINFKVNPFIMPPPPP